MVLLLRGFTVGFVDGDDVTGWGVEMLLDEDGLEKGERVGLRELGAPDGTFFFDDEVRRLLHCW